MRDLIERLEKATGPDRKLDSDICDFVFGKQPWYAPSPEWCRLYHAEPTSSIDAARTLSDWVLLTLSDIGADGLPYAVLGDPSQSPSVEVTGIGATPAIALCIAGLKTRSA